VDANVLPTMLSLLGLRRDCVAIELRHDVSIAYIVVCASFVMHIFHSTRQQQLWNQT